MPRKLSTTEVTEDTEVASYSIFDLVLRVPVSSVVAR
jgi:hypothetical protein